MGADITLGNPFGPFGKGRAAVLAALGNAAKKYTDGSDVRVERIAAYGGGKTFVLVEIEHDRAKLGAATEFSEFAARVTSVYEKNGTRWKLVHRHADPITSARPAESMLSHSTPKGIVGTWRMVSFKDVEDGKTIQRFGEKPVGLPVAAACVTDHFVWRGDGSASLKVVQFGVRILENGLRCSGACF